MWPDRVSNPGPPTYESGALPIALRGPATVYVKSIINYWIRIDGWVDDVRFTPFLTVFMSYEDDGRLITKGCVQWNLDYDWKGFRLKCGSNPGPLI